MYVYICISGHFGMRIYVFLDIFHTKFVTTGNLPIEQPHCYSSCIFLVSSMCEHQCVTACCNLLQCVAVCCRELQCFGVGGHTPVAVQGGKHPSQCRSLV